MLSKKNRLHISKDIKQTSLRGRGFFSPFFTVKYTKPPDEESRSRVAVVVSTKVSKKAVTRNRIRRCIRECFRLNLDRLKQGDYVIIVRPAASKLDNKSLTESLVKTLNGVKLLAKKGND